MSESLNLDCGEPWSDLEIRGLRRCIALGDPPNVIASYVSRPQQEVREKALELDLCLPWDDWDDLELLSALEAGHPIQDVARRLTRRRDDLEQRLRALGFSTGFFRVEKWRGTG